MLQTLKGWIQMLSTKSRSLSYIDDKFCSYNFHSQSPEHGTSTGRVSVLDVYSEIFAFMCIF